MTISSKYIVTLPAAKSPNYHPDSSAIFLGSTAGGWQDVGGWIYDSVPSDSNYGSIYVACTHTDTKGMFWTSY